MFSDIQYFLRQSLNDIVFFILYFYFSFWIIFHHQKRSKGRISQHPELEGESELKMNDSNTDEEEIVEIYNINCELVKATRKYKLSEKFQRKYCNQLQRIIKLIFIFYRSHHDAIHIPNTAFQQNDPL